MEAVERKKQRIEDKKKDLPEQFLKQTLGSLFIELNDVHERAQNGLKKIELISSFDDLYKKEGAAVVALDIRDMDYSADLDNIAYAKRMNDDLCVVVKDILVEEYQMYLYDMYNIDGVIFDTKNIDEKALEKVMNLARVMGVGMICSIDSAADFKKINKYEEMARLVVARSEDVLSNIPKGVYILKDDESGIDDKYADIVILNEANDE